MAENQRQHKRIDKRLTMQYCLADAFPRKWDMSIVENISAGGVKFTASNDLELNNQIIKLQIKLPELSPRCLEIEAVVLSAKPRANGRISDVRAKFINLSETDEADLSIVEKIITLQEARDASKGPGKKI